MKFILLGFGALAFLVGCGGSSSSVDEPALTPNSAPVLTGDFQIEALAAVSTTTEFTASDDDGDSLSVTIENAPEWLTLNYSNNKATIEIAPSFFDIGDYALELAVSDGTESIDYVINVSVTNNPAAYTNPSFEDMTYPVTLLINETEQVHLWDNGLGLLKTQENLFYALTWEASGNHLDVTAWQSGSMNLNAKETISIEALAKSDSQFRIKYTKDDAASQTLNTLAPETSSVLESSAWGPVNGISSRAIVVNEEEQTVTGWFDATEYFEGTTSSYLLAVDASYDSNTHSWNLSDFPQRQTSQRFENAESGSTESLTFNMVPINMGTSFKDNVLWVLKFDYYYELADGFEDITVEDYTGLQAFLDSERTLYFSQTILTEVEFAPLNAGDHVYASFNVNQTIDGKDYRSTSELSVTSDGGEGALVYSIFGDTITEAQIPVTLKTNGSQLTITDENQSTSYGLYQDLRGNQVILNLSSVDDNGANSYDVNFVVFNSEPETAYSISDYSGIYQEISWPAMFTNSLQWIGVFENGRMDLANYSVRPDSEDRALDYYEFDSETSSLNALGYNLGCESVEARDLQSCLAFLNDNPAYSFHHAHLSLIKSDGDLLYVKYNYTSHYNENTGIEDFASSRVEVWQRIEE